MPELINWLHLSDLHLGIDEQQWLWPSRKDDFFRDIEELTATIGGWDLVFFTGDFSQRGSKREFDQLNNELKEIWDSLAKSGTIPKICVVPGNHDLVRPAPFSNTTLILTKHWWSEPEARNQFWTDSECEARRAVEEYSRNYADWTTKLPVESLEVKPGILPGDFSATFTKGAIRLGIIGLNSTFLQIAPGNFEEKLDLHVSQLNAVCDNEPSKWLARQSANVLLTHQPVGWLHKTAQDHFYQEIYPGGRFLVHLCGHQHNPETSEVRSFGGIPRRTRLAPSLYGLEFIGEEKQERIFGYNAGQFIFEESRIVEVLWPRIAVKKRSGELCLGPDQSYHLLNGRVTTELLSRANERSARVDRAVTTRQDSPQDPIRGNYLVDHLCELSSQELVESLLLGRFSLDELVKELRPESATKFVRAVVEGNLETWQCLLASFVSGHIQIPPNEFIRLAFEREHRWGDWGGRTFSVGLLRFTPTKERKAVEQLLNDYTPDNDLPELDNERLRIIGLGFVGEHDSAIQNLIENYSALTVDYYNSKLAPYAILASLHSYLAEKSDFWGQQILAHIVHLITATSALNHLPGSFLEYYDELILMPPGKGLHLFRTFRDHKFTDPLTAVLTALCYHPNRALLPELLEIVKTPPTVGSSQLAAMAAAFIPGKEAEARLEALYRTGTENASAARLLAVGVARNLDSKETIASALRKERPLSDSGWLWEPVTWALWAAGELGYTDPDFAEQVLMPLTGEFDDPVARSMTWLGLAKANRVSSVRLEDEMSQAASSPERLILGLAGGFLGDVNLILEGLKSAIDNHTSIYRLAPYLERDVKLVLSKEPLPGGRDLLSLLDVGYFV